MGLMSRLGRKIFWPCNWGGEKKAVVSANEY